MKVILQKDVKGTGKAGDIVNVNDGYARNYLIPQKLALPADANSINAANIKKQAEAHRLDMQRKRARELAAGMNGLNVKVYAKCGEGGRLFGSIGAAEIAAGLKEQHGLDVDRKKIRLDEPIKALGTVKARPLPPRYGLCNILFAVPYGEYVSYAGQRVPQSHRAKIRPEVARAVVHGPPHHLEPGKILLFVKPHIWKMLVVLKQYIIMRLQALRHGRLKRKRLCFI